MSRSYRKVCGGGICTARTDKPFKEQEHRRFRRNVRMLLSQGEDEVFPKYSGKYGNPWASPKDGHGVWYWSVQAFLNTTIGKHTRTGEWYTPWWSTTPIRAMKYLERPATRGDWKKMMSK